MMERMILGKTGLEVYRLGFGGIPIQRVDERQAVETVLHAVESGVDFIDTSRAYSTSEERIGLALRQTNKKVVLATKSHERSADGILADLDISLKNLQTDYIDLYQCHFVKDIADYEAVVSAGGALQGLLKAREEGLIGHVGITSHNLDVLDRALEDELFETIMVCFSFLETAGQEKIIPKAIKKNIGVLAMKPFSGGVIEDANLALKYVLNQKSVLVLAGVEYKALFDQNWKIFQKVQSLTQAEQAAIEAIRKEYDRRFCRRCDYCQPCTEDIPIQLVLGIQSLVKRSGIAGLNRGPFGQAIEKARNCSECGECEARCPYGLPIRELIKLNIEWVDKRRAV